MQRREKNGKAEAEGAEQRLVEEQHADVARKPDGDQAGVVRAAAAARRALRLHVCARAAPQRALMRRACTRSSAAVTAPGGREGARVVYDRTRTRRRVITIAL
jgi:hypothetical protein